MVKLCIYISVCFQTWMTRCIHLQYKTHILGRGSNQNHLIRSFYVIRKNCLKSENRISFILTPGPCPEMNRWASKSFQTSDKGNNGLHIALNLCPSKGQLDGWLAKGLLTTLRMPLFKTSIISDYLNPLAAKRLRVKQSHLCQQLSCTCTYVY